MGNIKLPTTFQLTGIRQPRGRKEFKISTKRKALERAKYQCEKCHEKLKKSKYHRFGYIVNFDHFKSHTNNSLNNCRVLHPNCHTEDTVIRKRRYTNEIGMKTWQTIRKHAGIKVRKKKRKTNRKTKKKKFNRSPYDFNNILRI